MSAVRIQYQKLTTNSLKTRNKFNKKRPGLYKENKVTLKKIWTIKTHFIFWDGKICPKMLYIPK